VPKRKTAKSNGKGTGGNLGFEAKLWAAEARWSYLLTTAQAADDRPACGCRDGRDCAV
jgi:hypothetical protein